MKFTNTITIDRPLSQVFAYLADLENLPRWNYAIGATRKITAGPVDVGSRYLQTRTIPVHTEEQLEIIEFEPDHRLTIRGSLNSLPAQVTYTLRAEEGATFLTNTVDLQPPRHLKLVAPVATLRIKSAVAANLAVLKRTLEQA
ncbi:MULTISPECIES: SRPBCC family protein [unclassified Kribbella]|uniref:SRPBCC family protein n=1 Tax=unclassified Kribbella TaxID=2644121 RepID=UPI0030777903